MGAWAGAIQPSGPITYDDINVGDAVPELSKGPMTSLHIMRWSAAMENWHRIHYDVPFATQHDGLPDILINGSWKQHILMQMLKDWVGHTGRVLKIAYEYRGLDVRGMRIRAHGQVVKKFHSDEGFGIVKCEIGISNGKLESTTGSASVAVPSSADQPVPYPVSKELLDIIS